MPNPSAANILICGYPKSGTTWLTKLIADLLQCPACGFWEVAGDTLSQEGLDRIAPYNCYKAHQLYDQLLISPTPISKIIYVVRDPRDIVVSGAHHFVFLPNQLKAIFRRLIPSFVYRQKVLYQLNRLKSIKTKKQEMVNLVIGQRLKKLPWLHYSWSKHVQSFLNQPNVHLVKYEDVLLDPNQECLKILHFLDYSVEPKIIATMIKRNAFATKKQQYLSEQNTIMARHIRKGTANQWQSELTQQQVQEIYNACGKLMKNFGYTDF